ncbi:MAG: hypothetical protein COA55_08475 [Alcanivorax sp.]|nr:MAG: hypothetical protein COA55_08475 [Alcanivorax sp.]
MNRIPDDFDLSAVEGEELSQICIDQYQVQLNFDGASIVGGGELLLEKNGGGEATFLRFMDNHLWVRGFDWK